MRMNANLVAIALLAAGSAHAAAPAQLQQGQAATRVIATQGIQSLRPADPRALEAAIAQYRSAKAALPRDRAADLDAMARALGAKVIAAAAQGGDIRNATVQIVSMNAPALSRAQADALAVYVLNEIAAQGAAGGTPSQMAAAVKELQDSGAGGAEIKYMVQQQQLAEITRALNTLANLSRANHDTAMNSFRNMR